VLNYFIGIVIRVEFNVVKEYICGMNYKEQKFYAPREHKKRSFDKRKILMIALEI
jgi:hypothetical protein